MKVSQLISVLSEMDQDANAVVRGYEEGFNAVCGANTVRVSKSEHMSNTWYYGDYEKDDDGINAVHIVGRKAKDS